MKEEKANKNDEIFSEIEGGCQCKEMIILKKEAEKEKSNEKPGGKVGGEGSEFKNSDKIKNILQQNSKDNNNENEEINDDDGSST